MLPSEMCRAPTGTRHESSQEVRSAKLGPKRNVAPFHNTERCSVLSTDDTPQASSEGQCGDQYGRARSEAPRSKRADAVRNRQTLLAAAAEVFVDLRRRCAVREIAARAGVGMGTIYRHFPTRADLVVAVYRHQVEACAEAGPAAARGHRLAAVGAASVDRPLRRLPGHQARAGAFACSPRAAASARCTRYFLDRLLPVARELLDAAVEAGEIRTGIQPYELMRGIGNLCIASDEDPRYDPRRLIGLLLEGIRQPQAS